MELGNRNSFVRKASETDFTYDSNTILRKRFWTLGRSILWGRVDTNPLLKAPAQIRIDGFSCQCGWNGPVHPLTKARIILTRKGRGHKEKKKKKAEDMRE
ncbi:hypothetical protein CEXT_195531 [Caerostris extrusa]|uniref:Uncharacterized protein n=1 Tax=Caerostris extrusa TaxID=172846 RepID=A0AAV4U3G3_CAEEX|nr:hypothetical protein CEXT_195531 [Caerostris extrusa]